jgi:hypothetical protein
MIAAEIEDIQEAAGVTIYPASLTRAQDVTVFYARDEREKYVGALGWDKLDGSAAGEHEERPIILGPCNHANADAIRSLVSWTGPSAVGRGASAGLGDMLGASGGGHIQAIEEIGPAVAPVLAQLSVREMRLVGRPAQEVLDAATWGVLQSGYRKGFAAEAVDLRDTTDLLTAIRGGFTIFSLNPCEEVPLLPPDADIGWLAEVYGEVDFDLLETTGEEMAANYVDRSIPLGDGTEIRFDGSDFVQTVVRMGPVLMAVVKMARLLDEKGPDQRSLVVALHEMPTPTTVEEHYFVANELRRLGVQVGGLSPSLPCGEVLSRCSCSPDGMREWATRHAAVAKRCGPYKIVIAEGAGKQRLLRILAEATDGKMHTRLEGLGYLEAMRVVAAVEQRLFREILPFAVECFSNGLKAFNVKASPADLPPLEDIDNKELFRLLDNVTARQILYATVGAILTGQGGQRFREPIYRTIHANEELFYAFLKSAFLSHLQAVSG